MKDKGEKTFSETCSLCGGLRSWAKVMAKKGQNRIRICTNCDEVNET